MSDKNDCFSIRQKDRIIFVTRNLFWQIESTFHRLFLEPWK